MRPRKKPCIYDYGEQNTHVSITRVQRVKANTGRSNRTKVKQNNISV